MLDAIIVGAGASGLTAAQVLGRQRRDTLVIDSGKPRNAQASNVHMFPSRNGFPPDKLLHHARAELVAYPSVRLVNGVATAARGVIDDFGVGLADGSTHRARRLVLATGVVDLMPDVEGVAERFGRSVFHCPFCHGNEASGKTLAVLGRGAPGGMLALYLRDRFSEDVVLCSNGPAELPEPVAAQLNERYVPVREEPILGVEGELDAVTIRFSDGEPLTRQALFQRIGERQHSQLAAELGCEILPDGWVKVDAQQRTTVPGAYAAGDLARTEDVPVALTFVLTGAAAGQVAAVMLDGDLFRAAYPTVFPVPST